jgi:tripartite-type tricarboxylate transporter receptor subunit TctC
MKTLLRALMGAAWLAATALLAPAMAADAKFPDKPVTFIVPYAPGGETDLYARSMGNYLSRLWGVPVVVKNDSGGGTLIGTQEAARAAPDGYTLLMTSYGYTSNPILRKDVGYGKDDLRPLMLLGTTPALLVVTGSGNLRTLQDVVAKAKQSPGSLKIASSGIASSPHITAELWASLVGVQITHAPYRGTGPAVSDVIAGVVDGIFTSLQAMSQVPSGRLRPIAVASAKRHPMAPDVPTLRELGEDLTFGSWFGVFAPKGVPEGVFNQLNADLNKAAADPAVRAAIDPTGIVVVGGSPSDFAQFLDQESARLQKLVDGGAKFAVE